MIKKYDSDNSAKNIIDKSKFDELKNTAQYEIIDFAYSGEYYTRSLYYVIKLWQDKPGDGYLVTQMGKIFNSFYTSQKEHTLGRLIDLPSPYNATDYNLLLQFVQNLYLEDFSSINYNFLKQYYSQLNFYAPFKSAYNTSKKLFEQ